MGQCCGKPIRKSDGGVADADYHHPPSPLPTYAVKNTPPVRSTASSPWPSPYPQGVTNSPLPSPGTSSSTPRRRFKWPLPPPSPAKHIKASLIKRFGPAKPKEGTIPEESTFVEQSLDKRFGYGRDFDEKYELGKEVGRGHFGHTCMAKGKRGDLKGCPLAVKIISKAKVLL